ncbi:MAG: tetratricopeptide repeat protein [Planctomycetes bacterium]|nr:tetratricopeptide repeat protein [Planctomycetota bacterium]
MGAVNATPSPRDVDRLAAEAARLHAAGRLDEAAAACQSALALDDQAPAAWYGLGCVHVARKEHAAAIPCFRRAMALAPDDVQARHNLGQALFHMGQVEAALAEFQAALALRDNFLSRTAIAVAIPGSPAAGNQAILDARRAWARRHLPPHNPAKPFPGIRPDPDRRIRLAYTSAFFHRGNWMKPVWALINRHDRERFEVHLFSDAPDGQLDTGYRRHEGDRVHDISRLSNREAARLIERAGIDILVDLNSFSYVDRLAVLALQPAPVLVAWFNLFATSGMACLDYLVGDECVAPPDEERFYTERIVRVPGSYLAFEVTHPAPDVVPPPCLSRGALTFGSLASQYKLIPQVLAAWAQILSRCPTSRLVIKNAALGSPANRAFVQERLAELGVALDRVELDGPAPHLEFISKYGEIDVALDPFPYNGGTTTTEAIWQGVPVLTFDGDRWAARTSASLLRAAGLDEFVARDLKDYVERAATLAASPDTPARLADLRLGMRERLRQSPACDAAGFTAAMERAYARMWRRWCRRQGDRTII